MGSEQLKPHKSATRSLDSKGSWTVLTDILALSHCVSIQQCAFFCDLGVNPQVDDSAVLIVDDKLWRVEFERLWGREAVVVSILIGWDDAEEALLSVRRWEGLEDIELDRLGVSWCMEKRLL